MKKIIFFAASLIVIPFIGNAQWFTAGTCWIQENIPCDPNEEVTTSSYYLVENLEKPDEPILYNSLRPETPIAKIKTEGDKVLFSSIGREDSGWYLLYDFGLQPGDYCTVNSIPEGGNKRTERVYYCEEVDESNLAFGGWPTMKMWDVYTGDDGNPEFFDYGIWIKGIGSEKGVCDNCTIGYDGGGSKLLEVSHNGEIVYKENPAAISSTKADDFNVRVEDRKIIINSDIPGSLVEIVSIDGSNLFQGLTGPEQVIIDVTDAGIYVIKVGLSSKKIVIN